MTHPDTPADLDKRAITDRTITWKTQGQAAHLVEPMAAGPGAALPAALASGAVRNVPVGQDDPR